MKETIYSDDLLENIPYGKGLFKDGRVSSWYINPYNFELYKKNGKGEFVKTNYPIPTFVWGERQNRQQQKETLLWGK
tara:strand:+ start:798 stop:1028 length:231 start_codon:yes stop_codon:yes gene_type:complete